MSAVEEFHGLMAKRVVHTRKMRERLDQDQVWVDQQGIEHKLEDVDARYAGNIVRVLDARAKQLHDGECAEWLFLPEPRGDMAQFACEEERNALYATPADEWLREKPLYRALTATASTSQEPPDAA